MNIGSYQVPRALERAIRTVGAVALTSLGPQLPGMTDTFIAAIPLEYRVFGSALIHAVFKEIRMRYPESKFWANLPI